MKHFITTGLLFLLAGCTAFTPPTATSSPTAAPSLTPTEEEASSWELVFQQTAPVPVRMVAFYSESFGLLGGPNNEGRARYTNDSGKTWTMATSSSGCLFGFDVIDEQTAWECHSSDMRISRDGGQTWEGGPVGMGNPGCQMSAVDDKNLWYSSKSQLKTSSDGGSTWETVNLPEGVSFEQIIGVSLRAPGQGYIMAADGTLYTTTDNGENWTSQELPFEKSGGLRPKSQGMLPAAAMRFQDADHGTVVLSLAGSKSLRVVSLHTSDGGASWTEQLALDNVLGVPYLTHDGKLLTVTNSINRDYYVLRMGGD